MTGSGNDQELPAKPEQTGSERTRSELIHRIDSRTDHQVSNLHVVHEAGRVTLRGQSRSYYVKQLATHAVLDLLPGVSIDNAIDVMRS